MGGIRHIITWAGLLLSIACLLSFGYGMHKSYQSMLPKDVYIRFADLEPLPRGLSSIDKLLGERLTDSLSVTSMGAKKEAMSIMKGFRCKSLVVYRYKGHTLYDVINDNLLTIPAHITDTLPPVYMAPPPEATTWSDSLLQGTMSLDRYALDYRRIIARYDRQVSRIEWNSFDTIPIYIISLKGHDEPIYINASTQFVKPFYLSDEVVAGAVKSFCQSDIISTELLTDYDNYYADLQHIDPLPIWKVTTGQYTFYVNPRTGAFLRYNTSSWWCYLLDHAFNDLRYKLFAKHPEFWSPVMWMILILGTLLSLTSVLVFTRRIMNNKTKSN